MLPALNSQDSKNTATGANGGVERTTSSGIGVKSALSATKSTTSPPSKDGGSDPQNSQNVPIASQSQLNTQKPPLSNFFNTKGPIRPQNMLPTAAMVNTPLVQLSGNMYHPSQIAALHSRPDQPMQQHQQQRGAGVLGGMDQYYDEEEEYGDELDYGQEADGGGSGAQQRAGGRVLSPEEEAHILSYLTASASKNREFLKVLNILQNDPELRPLIFEHEALLKALKDMMELKAEQMLSILTAAETEMYESSKKNEESQQLNRSNAFSQNRPEMKSIEVQTELDKENPSTTGAPTIGETSQFKVQLEKVERENSELQRRVKEQESILKSKDNKGLVEDFQSQMRELTEKNRNLEDNLNEVKSKLERKEKDLKQKVTQMETERKRFENLLEQQSLATEEANKAYERCKIDLKKVENEQKSRDVELKRQKESAISLNKQISTLKQNLVESETAQDSLKKENSEMMKKVSQFRGQSQHVAPTQDDPSLNKFVQNEKNRADEEPYRRPESSHQRVRIDDSNSQQDARLQAPSVLSDQQEARRGKRNNLSPEFDFGNQDLESMAGVQKSELLKLREENVELKQRLDLLRKEDPKPQMATFSPVRESIRESHSVPDFGASSLTETKEAFGNASNRLGEVGKRLLNLMKKIGCHGIESYQAPNNQAWSISLLKDLVYEIHAQIDQILSNNSSSQHNYLHSMQSQQPHQNVFSNQWQTRLPNHRTSPLDSSSVNQTPQQHNHQQDKQQVVSGGVDQEQQVGTKLLGAGNIYENCGPGEGDTTMDMTNQNWRGMSPSSRDNSGGRSAAGVGLIADTHLKQQMLEEKERRLTIQESLMRTKEDAFVYQKEIEALKMELRKRPLLTTTFTDRRKILDQDTVDQLQDHNDRLQDEVVSFKLRISDLESELLDEKHNKKVNYQMTLDTIKASVHEQVLDNKIRFEEQIMHEKEQCHKQKITIMGLEQRIEIFKETNGALKSRVEELERENLGQAKQNFVLNQELDYESIKNDQIFKRTEKMQVQLDERNLVSRSRLNEIIRDYESQIAQLNQQLKSVEENPFDKMAKDKLEREVHQLRTENAQLIKDKILLKKIPSNNDNHNTAAAAVSVSDSQQTATVKDKDLRMKFGKGQGGADKQQLLGTSHSMSQQTGCSQRVKGLVLRLIKRSQSQFNKAAAFFALKSLIIDPLNSTSDNKAVLQDRLYMAQTQITQLCKQIGKIVREAASKKQIRLHLNGMLSNGGLDYILAGLNGHDAVNELNLGGNSLEDEDFARIAQRLSQTPGGIQKLKLANNEFTDHKPLLQIIDGVGHQLVSLDFSKLGFQEKEDYESLARSLSQLSVIEELAMSNIINSNLQEKGGKTFEPNLDMLFTQIARLRSLRCLDMSKNKFSQSAIQQMAEKLPKLPCIHTLCLSQINLQDESLPNFCRMITKLGLLKRINLSNNLSVTMQGIPKILQSLSFIGANLEAIDLSKLNFGNSRENFTNLANLIRNSKKLRSLAVQRIGATDTNLSVIIDAVLEKKTFEVLKADFNKLRDGFVSEFCQKLVLNGFTDKENNKVDHNASQSILATDSEDQEGAYSEGQLSRRSAKKQPRNDDGTPNGLLMLSFEGNPLGDDGAQAIASMIQVKCDTTRYLKTINLNECSIGNSGFQALRQALGTRGSLTREINVTHVGIKVERNLFEM